MAWLFVEVPNKASAIDRQTIIVYYETPSKDGYIDRIGCPTNSMDI
jgi:hypothetical protein